MHKDRFLGRDPYHLMAAGMRHALTCVSLHIFTFNFACWNKLITSKMLTYSPVLGFTQTDMAVMNSISATCKVEISQIVSSQRDSQPLNRIQNNFISVQPDCSLQKQTSRRSTLSHDSIAGRTWFPCGLQSMSRGDWSTPKPELDLICEPGLQLLAKIDLP